VRKLSSDEGLKVMNIGNFKCEVGGEKLVE